MTSAIFFRFCMARVYLVGHSRGGKISALAALEDPRVAALCLLDPVSWGCEEETGMALSEDAVLVYSCCNVHFRPGGLRMWGGSWNDNVWICGACIKLLQCAFQAWWVKGVRRKLQPQALANSSYAGFSLHAFLPLCISSWSVLHHYEYFIMMSVSSWWVFRHDECFIMMCVSSWWVFHHDECFIMMSVSSWWVFHHDECYIMMSVSSWRVFHHDECFIMMSVSSWWVFHHDECFIIMSVSSWWVFHHDECFIIMSVSWWWVFHDDECFLMMSVSSWWVFPHDECFIMMSASPWWVFHHDECYIMMSVSSCTSALNRQSAPGRPGMKPCPPPPLPP